MSVTKIGFLFSHLGGNQLTHSVVNAAKKLLVARLDVDVVLFYETAETSRAGTLPCAAMPIREAWGYDGLCVATSFSTAAKLITFPGAKSRLFYIWDVEWARKPSRSFESMVEVYRHSSLNLAARSKDLAKVASAAWNREVALIPEESMGELLCPAN